MTWFKVDDGLPVSRKVMSIPRTIRLSSIGLWTLAGAWSAAEELDGHVPAFMVAELGGTEKAASALVKSGLWEKVDDGYQFAKWAEYQPTRADMDDRRRREADRKREWRKRKRPANVPAGQTVGHHAESANRPRYPDPTRPDLLTTDVVSRSRAARREPVPIPDDWAPNDVHRAKLGKLPAGIDLEAEAEAFRNHALSVDRRQANWDAAFHNWLAKARPREKSGVGAATTKAQGWLALADQLPPDPDPERRAIS